MSALTPAMPCPGSVFFRQLQSIEISTVASRIIVKTPAAKVYGTGAMPPKKSVEVTVAYASALPLRVCVTLKSMLLILFRIAESWVDVISPDVALYMSTSEVAVVARIGLITHALAVVLLSAAPVALRMIELALFCVSPALWPMEIELLPTVPSP